MAFQVTMATIAALVPSGIIDKLDTTLTERELKKLQTEGNKPQNHLAYFEIAECSYFALSIPSQERLQMHYEHIRSLGKKELQDYYSQLMDYIEQKNGWRKLYSRQTEHWRRAVACITYARNRSRYAPD